MSRFSIVMLLALLPVSVWSQISFELCRLTIHVRMADNNAPGSYLQVELFSTAGPMVSAAQTNADGTADFQVPSGANYRVRISGRGIEPAESEFFIFGGNHTQTQNLNVKRAAVSKQEGIPASVSVTEMQVPEKAKEEMQKGIEAFDKGDTSKAKQRFEKAISIYPQYARAYENLGVIAAKSGDRAQARSLYLKALELDDRLLPAYLQLARLEVQDKNYSQAESLLQKAMPLFPDMPDLIAVLASAEFGNKEYAKALADAQSVHTLPHHEQVASVHLLAAQILEMQNRGQDAILEYRLFLTEAPRSPQVKAVQQAIADLEAAKR